MFTCYRVYQFLKYRSSVRVFPCFEVRVIVIWRGEKRMLGRKYERVKLFWKRKSGVSTSDKREAKILWMFTYSHILWRQSIFGGWSYRNPEPPEWSKEEEGKFLVKLNVFFYIAFKMKFWRSWREKQPENKLSSLNFMSNYSRSVEEEIWRLNQPLQILSSLRCIRLAMGNYHLMAYGWHSESEL